MIRLLHIADLHMGWEPKNLPGDKAKIRRRERDQLLEKAVNIALDPQYKINGMIIAGDLFESFNPEETLIRETMRQISRLIAAGMFVVTVPGNHDEITYRESVYRTRGNQWPGILITNPMPEHCLTTVVNNMPMHLYSLAYTGGVTNPVAIREYPKISEEGFHIGVFHGSLDWNGLPDRSLPLSSVKLASVGYDYVALGHYHGFSEKKTGKGIAVYPGATEFKSFDDPGTGHIIIVSWNGCITSTEKVPISVRTSESIDLDISMIESYDELKLLCRSGSDINKILQINFMGTPRFNLNEDHLLEELEAEYFNIEIKNKARYYSDYFLDKVIHEPTVRGVFAKRMKDRIESVHDDREQKVLEQALLKGLQALEGSWYNGQY